MRRVALAGAALVAVVDVLYLAMIQSQPSQPVVSLRVPFVAAFIAAMAISAALASRLRLERYAPLLLGLSATGLVAMGLIAIFSVGVAILLAAIPVVAAAAVALIRARQPIGILQAVGGLVLALTVIVGGIQFTEVPMACPPTGYVGGSGPGLLGGPYHWTCVNGKLTIAPGECTHGGATVDSSGKVIATNGC